MVASFRFCGVCGAEISAAAPHTAPLIPADPPAVSTTERRVCSVVFADLVGFTPLSEARDPEEVRELLSRYFVTARTVISRYGGVIEKFIGDAVMAVWGSPIASEGDAERAVRAALDVVSAVADLGRELAVEGLTARAGVVTGEVAAALGVVGEGMVAGDAVNTAARVQGAAEPGTVWVDTATQRLAAAGVGFRNTGTHRLKGKAEPLELWQATRVLSSVGGVQRVDGLEAPMIGRDAENRTLRELFHAGVDRTAPRLVTVVGAAGSGKSRLGWEFEKYVDGLAENVAWHRGRCVSYNDGVAYWALAEALRQRFGIAVESPSDEATEKFVAGLQRWVTAPEERSFVGVRLGRLLGLTHPADTGAPLGQDELFAGWRLFLQRLASTSPVVILIEDAHHADDALLDFLEHVADWSRQSPIYIVLLGRSELIERRPGLAGGRNRSSLTLDPLTERSMRQLVSALVQDMPESAVAAIVEQARGNPLFAVETVRSLIDRDVIVPLEGEYHLVGDVGTLSVPDSLHGLLAARLDALDPTLRAMLADAAVLGGSFFAEALAAVSGRDERDVTVDLAELVRREVLEVSSDPLSPERGSYLFSETMLRQVAYDTLSRRDRKLRHLAVAAYLRTAYVNDGDEVVAVVAQHYVDALAAVPSDDDTETLRAAAIETLTRSAERAARAGSPRRAAMSLAQAAELAGDNSGLAADLSDRAARLATVGGLVDLALEQSRAAALLYAQMGHDRAVARSQITAATALRNVMRHGDARAELGAALAALRAPADRDTVLAITELSALESLDGNPGRAIELAREALDIAQTLGVDPDLMARVFIGHSQGCHFGNKHEEAVASIEHAIRLVDGDRNTAAWTRALIVLSDLLLTGNPVRALEAARHARDLALRLGDISSLSLGFFNMGSASIWLGQWADVELVLHDAEQHGLADDGIVQQLRAMLAGLRGDLGQLDRLTALPNPESADGQDAMYANVISTMVALAEGDAPRAISTAVAALVKGSTIGFRHETFVWCWTLAWQAAQALNDRTTRAALLDMLDANTDGYWPALLLAERALARSLDDCSPSAVHDAISALRTAGSPYHLAHALLDQATFLAGSNSAAAQACRDEAALINETLHAVTLTHRLTEMAEPADHSTVA